MRGTRGPGRAVGADPFLLAAGEQGPGTVEYRPDGAVGVGEQVQIA
ncbi:MAG: hypothetical protein ACRDNT_24630 [Streptosporangiaceae bacterium]